MLLLPLSAQQKPDSTIYSAEYLDTVVVGTNKEINNYSMIGVNYGVSFSNMSFNPERHNRAFVYNPNYFSIMYTHYEKMFDYLPYFAFSAGFDHGYEGVAFKENPSTGQAYGNVDGATKMSIEVYEMPVMAQMHVDAAPLKFMATVGAYIGYRTKVQRSGPYLDETYANAFHDYENRFDYGMQAGAGIAFMFDPFELHINGLFRWGWASLYRPDYYSEYYYRFANPTDIMVSVGIHYQLTKRTGKTTRQIKRQAKEIVYGKASNSSGSGR